MAELFLKNIIILIGIIAIAALLEYYAWYLTNTNNSQQSASNTFIQSVTPSPSTNLSISTPPRQPNVSTSTSTSTTKLSPENPRNTNTSRDNTKKYQFIPRRKPNNLQYINISHSYKEDLNQRTINISYYASFYGSSLKNYNKSNNDNDNICNLPNLLFVHYHKTHGYQKYWSRFFQYECIIYGGPLGIQINVRNSENVTKNIKSLNGTMINSLSISKLFMFHGVICDALKTRISLINKYKQRYLIMVMEREPLQTILSGYNYHAAGNERDWTDRFPVKQKTKEAFIDIFDKNKYLINMRETTMYKEYYKGYKNNYENKTELKYGLYLEFTRYANTEWYKHISNYEYLKNNDNNIPFIIARFEWFHDYDYRQSIIYILNEMGFNGNSNLFSGLLSGDLSISKQIRNSKHVTSGKYNKSLQIDLLLNYKNVCKYIKNMTIKLDYKWRYNLYC